MHPRDSASRGTSPPRPLGCPAFEKTAEGPVAGLPRTRFHRLRTALKARPQLRLPRPLFSGDANTELHCITRTPRIQSHQRKCGNGLAHSAENKGRFYLLAEPFRCPTIGEPLSSCRNKYPHRSRPDCFLHLDRSSHHDDMVWEQRRRRSSQILDQSTRRSGWAAFRRGARTEPAIARNPFWVRVARSPVPQANYQH